MTLPKTDARLCMGELGFALYLCRLRSTREELLLHRVFYLLEGTVAAIVARASEAVKEP